MIADARIELVTIVPARSDVEADAGGIEGPLLTPEEADREWEQAVTAGHHALFHAACGQSFHDTYSARFENHLNGNFCRCGVTNIASAGGDTSRGSTTVVASGGAPGRIEQRARVVVEQAAIHELGPGGDGFHRRGGNPLRGERMDERVPVDLPESRAGALDQQAKPVQIALDLPDGVALDAVAVAEGGVRVTVTGTDVVATDLVAS